MRLERLPYALPLALCLVSAADATDVAVCTDLGRIVIELFDDDAPAHAANFLDYTDRGFYGGTVFHRVIDGFVVQGGGFDKDLRGKRPSGTVANESRNGHDNDRGTVAAARASDPDSASSQFFINLTDNPALDSTRREPGYTVFGEVVEGMSVVDEISRLPTGGNETFASDVPDPLIGVSSVVRREDEQFSDVPYQQRHELILAEINTAISAEDDNSVFEWLRQYRIACGVMDPELLLTESNASVVLGKETAALAALEEYLRVAEDTHSGYGAAVAQYLELLPDAPVSTATQVMMPGAAELAEHCVAPEIPSIPDGRTVTMDEMLVGQAEVRSYMTVSNEYLSCLAEIIDDDEVLKEDRARLSSTHNRVVDSMESVAASFNDQVKLIRARQ